MLTNKTRSLFFVSFALIFVFVAGIYAGQPVVWETSSRVELLKGDARGVSITDTGVITLAPKLNELFNTQQTYIWSSAVDAQGKCLPGYWPRWGRFSKSPRRAPARFCMTQPSSTSLRSR
jgi:hypothetical protein